MQQLNMLATQAQYIVGWKKQDIKLYNYDFQFKKKKRHAYEIRTERNVAKY